MGDVGCQAEQSHAPAQSNTRTSTTTTSDEDDEPAYEGPTYTPMGDSGTESKRRETTTSKTKEGEYTPNGDHAARTTRPRRRTSRTEAEPTTDARGGRPGLHADGRRGAAGCRVHGPAGPAPTYAGDDGWEASVTGSWVVGGTLGLASDGEDTALTIGIAEGFGLFGSAGEGDAPEE